MILVSHTACSRKIADLVLWLLEAETDLLMWLSDDDELKHHDHITQPVRCFQSDSFC
jgi:hypothetical protein